MEMLQNYSLQVISFAWKTVISYFPNYFFHVLKWLIVTNNEQTLGVQIYTNFQLNT